MSATASWSTQCEALAVKALRCAGRLRLRVHGESMLPTLWPGDTAEIEVAALADIRPGDIVLAFRDGRFFLHRFLQPCTGGFLARGDSMPGADRTYSSDALLGRLVGVERSGEMAAPLPLRPWSRALGLTFCYSDWARHLALKLHRRWLQAPALELNLSTLTSDLGHRETP